MPKAPVDAARLSGIAHAIRSELSPILDADGTRDEAKLALDNAKDDSVNAREAIMVKLANLAIVDRWTKPEIDTGAREGGKMGNAETPKAIATFLGEAKLAMDPAVRGALGAIIGTRDDAWQAETDARELDKQAPTPIRKAFKRKYHFLMTLMREATEGRYYETTRQCVDFATSRDPDHDPKKVLARLQKIVGDLTLFHGDFPDADIDACIGFLNAITEEDLTAARAEKLGLPETTVAQPNELAPEPATVVAATPAPAEPEYPDIDELLGDAYDGKLAARISQLAA